jgi:hypothetical protein
MSILPEFQQVNWELFFACDSLNADPFQPTGLSILHGFPHFFHGLGIFQNLRRRQPLSVQIVPDVQTIRRQAAAPVFPIVQDVPFQHS